MNEDFVTYKLAVKLKEKGFREECLYHYTCFGDLLPNQNYCNGCVSTEECFYSHNWNCDFIDTPTILQVLKWLREEKKIHITIDIWDRTWGYDIIELSSGNSLHFTAYKKEINSYEQAALAGIEYVLDNLI